ncbi:hypothetical protein [Crocosphaera sp. Alani8]|uniref:hypothetical protein n=1 Tax=Crocosphaera sp. Alani8 TaxID=3038952 RepID=UPI00313B4275
MAFFRQYVAPMLIVLMFLVALVAVTARAFIPSDLAAPAPIDDISYLLSTVSFLHL